MTKRSEEKKAKQQVKYEAHKKRHDAAIQAEKDRVAAAAEKKRLELAAKAEEEQARRQALRIKALQDVKGWDGSYTTPKKRRK